MLKDAFKEWAVICRALADGRQSLILRKGGVAEAGGAFEPERRRFWLFPTYLHQTRAALKPDAWPLLNAAESARPPDGKVWLAHFAEVSAVHHVEDLDALLRLDPLHEWSEETVRARFAYRQPGVYVLAARVYRVPETIEIPDTAYYAGCKSWVDLERAVPTDGAVPVLSDDAFRDVERLLDLLLPPTAFA